MNFLELFFKKTDKKKTDSAAVKNQKALQTSRKPVQLMSVEDIEAKKKEEELLNKIRSGLENIKHQRENSTKTYFAPILKYINDETIRLEEQIKTESKNAPQFKTDYNECGFYNQYTLGQFVVSL